MLFHPSFVKATKRLLAVILVTSLSGCAMMTSPGAPFYGMGQKDKLDKAFALQKQGKSEDAIKLLSGIVNEPGVTGVTDEALFRLGVLRIGSGFGSDSVDKGKKDLDRLAKEYPASSWTLLASPLREFLASSDKALRQGKKLSEQNVSLAKENRELKENIISMAREMKSAKESCVSLTKENADLRERVEKLKYIDLDLEKGSKRLRRHNVR